MANPNPTVEQQKNYRNTSTLRRESPRTLREIEDGLRAELRTAVSPDRPAGTTPEEQANYIKLVEEDIAWVQHVASDSQHSNERRPEKSSAPPSKQG